MSIEDLCQGDTVHAQERSADDISPLGGESESWGEDGDAITCRIESASSEVSEKYKAKGIRVTHQAFFASNVSLTAAKRLHWTYTKHTEALTGKYLKVEGYYREDSPNDDPDMRMWIADLTADVSRNDEDEAAE